MRALDAILAQQWAIYPAALQTLREIASRAPINMENVAAWKPGRETLDELRVPGAVAARAGTPIKGARLATMRGATAVLPIIGPIFPRANLMTDMSGATALSHLSSDLTVALDNDDVRSILLEIDSPGGVAFGIAELAERIAAAAERKRVVAYVDGMGASAAYWLAVAAGEVVINRSAIVGSIGVVQAASVQEAPDADGHRTIEIVSSNAENKRPDPRSEEGLAEIRRTLDAIEAVFVGDVAKWRGVSVDDVIAQFGRGGVKTGGAAVAVGMADRIGTFEEVLADLASGTGRIASTGIAAALVNPPVSAVMETGVVTMPKLSATEVAKENPEAAAALRSEGEETARVAIAAEAAGLTAEQLAARHAPAATALREEGASAERGRLKAIDDLVVPGCEAIAETAKADGATPEQFAVRQAQHQKSLGATALANLTTDAIATGKELPAPAASASGDDGGSGEAARAADTPEGDKERFRASTDLQDEFKAAGGESAYLAFCEGVRDKRVRLFRGAEQIAPQLN